MRMHVSVAVRCIGVSICACSHTSVSVYLYAPQYWLNKVAREHSPVHSGTQKRQLAVDTLALQCLLACLLPLALAVGQPHA